MNHKIINICHVLTRLDIGGMENGVVNICNELDRKLFKLTVCCLNSSGPMASRLLSDVEVCDLGLSEGKNLRNLLKVASYFRHASPDIVHTHAWGAGSIYGIVGARLAKVPIVINGEHGSFFTKKYQILIQRLLFHLCNANLAVSDSLKHKVEEILFVPADRITVIKNGVDTEIFSGNYSRSDTIERLYNEGFSIDEKNFNIISVGSLKPEKSQLTLLNAVCDNTILKSSVPVKVLLIGDGPDRPSLNMFVERYGLKDTVLFLGNRSDIPELLNIADLAVSTSVSKHEGLSNFILEAMASGVPVIATKSVGSKELINDNLNGYLIDENNIEELKQKI